MSNAMKLFFNLRNFLTKIASWTITKRQKFILTAGFLTVFLVTSQTVPESLRFQTIAVLALATLVLSIFSLWGELSGIKYFLLLLLPVYFVSGVTLFYFLLPVRWLTRLPFAFLFGISVYLLMLTANIYNVAAIRTIALLRAAHAVGLLFSLTSTFFLTHVLFFWPIVPINAALVLATIMYVLLGLSQFDFQGRLKPRLVWEHLGIAIFVFVIILMTTRWG